MNSTAPGVSECTRTEPGGFECHFPSTHRTLFSRPHVDAAMRLYMVQLKPLGPHEGGERADLVEEDVAQLFSGHLHFAATKALKIRKRASGRRA